MRWREEKNRGREGDFRGKVGEKWEEGRRAEGMVKALKRKELRVGVRVGLKMEGRGCTEGKRTMKELGGGEWGG